MMAARARRTSRLLSFGLALLASVVALAAAPPGALAARPASVTRGLDYLHAAQGGSGQFVDVGYTPWAVIAIAACGENPAGPAWRRNGKTPMDYLQSTDLASYATRGSAGNAANYYAKMILAYVAAGRRSQITAAGARKVNLVSKLLAFQRSDGRFSPTPSAPSIAAVNTTTWAVIALTAAQTGQSSANSAVAWLCTQQLSDGGFSNNAKDAGVGMPSDVDGTSAVIQALVAGGVKPSASVLKNARAYLSRAQRADGGFSSSLNGPYTYSESTAWAIQAILALGEKPTSSAWTKGGRTPRSALTALQAGNGAFQHKKGTLALPVLSTTQTLCALSGKSFAWFPRRRGSWITSFAATPRISGFSPAAGATVQSSSVTIRASYRDPAGGTGIATSGVKIVVDGRDKTGKAKVGASSLTLLLAHPTTGRHTVTLTVRDRAGNVRRAAHSFTLAAPGSGGGTGGGRGGSDGGSGGGTSPNLANGGSGSAGAQSSTTASGAGGSAAEADGAAAVAQPGAGETVTPGVAQSSQAAGVAPQSQQSQAQSAVATGTPAQAPSTSGPQRGTLVFVALAIALLSAGFGAACYDNRQVVSAGEVLRQAVPPDRRLV